MYLSETVRGITPSMTIGMDDRARQLGRTGVGVISFAAGEPDFDTPDAVKNAAITAIREGFTKYTGPAGIPELRAAVAAHLKELYGASYAPEEIVITAAGKPALYFTLRALCDPGDEVLVPIPAWVSYAEQVRVAGARPVFVPTDAASGWQPLPDRVAPLVSSRTRAIILTSPHNPTGAVYDRETLDGIAQLSDRHGFALLSDEIYESMVYDGARHLCVPAVWPAARDRIVLLNSMSKTYAMTGWRIGYAAAPRPVAEAITALQGHLAGSPNSIAQKAALHALTARVNLREMVAEYDRRRRYMVGRLNEIAGVSCSMPRGAFYAFPDVQELLGRGGAPATSLALAERLLDEAHVAVVPGEAFESPGFLRLSYATSMDRIRDGLARIANVLASYAVRV
ncbi:MAG TPA: pyridoxal phosphate-dependent aminotransferase [bacterium]|nr:pyridoxal phosphate-dependent aminotransferase [bacterium]